MSHYTIDYAPMIKEHGEEAAKRQACLDAIRYLGQPASRAFFRAVMYTDQPEDAKTSLQFFGGVSGFPLRALYERALVRRKL